MCVCQSVTPNHQITPYGRICYQSRLYALVAVAPIVAYTETDHDCMVHDVTRYQSAMSDLSKLYATDDDQGLGDWRAGPPDN